MLRRSIEQRRKAYWFGLYAEWCCIALLWLKGYSVLTWRRRKKIGELDIVARRGDQLVFVEVKARRVLPPEVLTAKQRQRILRAASAFAAHPKYAGQETRFDLMVVAPWRLPQHIQAAWRA